MCPILTPSLLTNTIIVTSFEKAEEMRIDCLRHQCALWDETLNRCGLQAV